MNKDEKLQKQFEDFDEYAVKLEENMETKYYTVARIDSEYAWLNRTNKEEESLLVARELLPEESDGGDEAEVRNAPV